jgi:hypothetical protein
MANLKNKKQNSPHKTKFILYVLRNYIQNKLDNILLEEVSNAIVQFVTANCSQTPFVPRLLFISNKLNVDINCNYSKQIYFMRAALLQPTKNHFYLSSPPHQSRCIATLWWLSSVSQQIMRQFTGSSLLPPAHSSTIRYCARLEGCQTA